MQESKFYSGMNLLWWIRTFNITFAAVSFMLFQDQIKPNIRAEVNFEIIFTYTGGIVRAKPLNAKKTT